MSKIEPQRFVDQLDRDSVVPLYHQLYEILRAHIDRGDWTPGDMIPTEAELNEKYGVSQITTRQALNGLVDAGLVYRQRGKGTFVARPVITSNLTRIVNFEEDMRQRGFAHRTEVLETALVQVSKNTAALLKIEVGEKLAQITRLRYADEEPLSVEKTFLVDKYCPGILEFDFSVVSLSKTLQQQYGITLSRAEQTIRAQSAGDDYADLLNIAPEDSLLVIERVAFSQHNIPIEFLRIFYRADRYSLHCELKGG
jgi:GntR family transcriptional regulator